MNLTGKYFIMKMKDDITGIEYSLLDMIKTLTKRVEVLEQEAVEASNEIYELQNRIDMMQNYQEKKIK
jgi:hypothetical protein